MARKLSYLVMAVAGIALAGAAASWLQSRPLAATPVSGASSAASQPAGARRVAGVDVARVVAQPLRDDAQAVGSLRASQSVMLRPEVAGRIAALGFKDGQAVRRGQVLVQLDDVLQQAEVQQAQAQLAIAQASFRRTGELVAANFVAQQTLDTAAANLQVAQAQLALARARLSRMAISAPFDATAGIRLVNLGDYVKDGADLVALEDTRAMLVDFRLPERYGGRLKAGQPVEVTLDALPGLNFKALVAAIDPLQDASGRSVGVRAVLPNIGQPLRSGMFARTTTVFSVNPSALVVPEEAIVPQGGRQFVIKVVAPAAVPDAGKLPPDTRWVSLRQEVKLGVRRLGQVEITAGVAAGDSVVVAGQQRLQQDGTPLRIVELGQPGTGKPSGVASGTGPAVSLPPAASASDKVPAAVSAVGAVGAS
jgi:membrane fusion protein (multidrug efflux system)